jgi:putative membrane protein
MESKDSLKTINAISIVVPLIVAILLGIRSKPDLGDWTKVLPHVIGLINGLTSVLLILGLILVKQKRIALHRKVMTSAFILGALFLVLYVLYHLTNSSTSFGGEGWIKYFYYFNLLTHIGLSLVVLPLVLRAYYFAWKGQIERHKKLVKFAYPIWLYVSLSGVVAYLLISPYYA